MEKNTRVQDVRRYFGDGMTIMYGGFLGIGTPEGLVQELLNSGARNLTLIGNDTAFVDQGVGPLIVNKRVARLVASHIGTNPETGRQMIAGELEVELVPQGTLAERIRCGGAGLGGILTETGDDGLIAKLSIAKCRDIFEGAKPETRASLLAFLLGTQPDVLIGAGRLGDNLMRAMIEKGMASHADAFATFGSRRRT